MTTLRNKLIRLAHENPEFRDRILPLVANKQAGQQKNESGNVQFRISGQDWTPAGTVGNRMYYTANGKSNLTVNVGALGRLEINANWKGKATKTLGGNTTWSWDIDVALTKTTVDSTCAAPLLHSFTLKYLNLKGVQELFGSEPGVRTRRI